MRLLVVALLLPLAACGGGDSYDSIEAVADAAECSGIKLDGADERTLFATESGYCDLGGEQQRVNWFKSDESVDSFAEVADKMGGGYVLYGNNWAIECADEETCNEMQENAGGEVR